MATLSQFQPLFPEESASGELQELASTLVADCLRLAGQAGKPILLSLGPKLRAMNSYYTNKIEGQHTRPADIERALRKEFDADLALARKQRLAVAHMQAEEECEQTHSGPKAGDLFAADFVRDIHRRLYEKLHAEDRVTDEGVSIIPGEYRRQEVTAGRYVAPQWADVPDFMRCWGERYDQLRGMEAQIIGIACAHHRLAWIHPFIDGNGRAARLHSHLVLHAKGLTNGIWSPMRGLARTQDAYYARLSNADVPRRNDLDGRGALSQEELVAFAKYFLEICLDQVTFMRNQVDFESLRLRMKDLLMSLQEAPWTIGSEKSVVKIEALEPLHYAAISGPMERSRFVSMTGLGDRTGRRVLASLLDYGVLHAPSPRAPVTFSVPLKSLRFLFPRLWPEAES